MNNHIASNLRRNFKGKEGFNNFTFIVKTVGNLISKVK